MKNLQILVSIPLFLIALLLAGCTTMVDAAAARGTGTKVVYQASFDAVWAELPALVREVGLELVSTNIADRSILAHRGVNTMSYGENVAIFVEKLGPNRCSVEIVSKRVMQTNVFATDWTKTLFEVLDKRHPKGTDAGSQSQTIEAALPAPRPAPLA